MKSTLFSILIIFSISNLFGQGFFSELQVGARQQGMGEAFVGVADDGEAVCYNPAGLTNVSNIEIISLYTKQLSHLVQSGNGIGINSSYIGYAQNISPKIGTLGFRWFYRGYYYENVFNAGEHIFMFAYGRNLFDIADVFPETKWLNYLKPLSVGLGVKAMKSGFYDADALINNPLVGNENVSDWTWSMDLSFYYKLLERYSFGFIYKDFNRPNSTMIDNKYLDKMDYSLGFGYKYSSNLKDIIAVDMVSENSNYAFNFGTEKYWDLTYKDKKDQFVIRSGFKVGFEDDYNWSVGFGYALNGFEKIMGFNSQSILKFDYAYKVLFGNISDGPGNHSFQFSLLLP